MMNSRIRPPLYISFKSWLCCCSLPSVAPQQLRRFLQLTFGSIWLFFYSDVEPLSHYSPVMLHLSPATRILNENPELNTFVHTMCGSRKYPYPPPTEDILICTPHPPGFSVPGGSLMTPPPPRNFQNFNRGLLTTLGNSKWFLYL